MPNCGIYTAVWTSKENEKGKTMKQKRQLKKVFVVFKTHFDLGFTDLAGNVMDWYGKGMIEGALDVCRASEQEPEGRQYVWTVPAWCMEKTLKDIEKTEIREETEHFLRTGQLVWHALPFTTHTEACGTEDFIRGLLIGKRLERAYRHDIHAAKMTDVPGHTWMLPTILHEAGVTFLHLGCNDCCTPPDLPQLFWWEGPDGSRVLTFYSRGGYGSGLVPPDDWEYPYWLALMHTGDNRGAQNADYLKELFARAEREMPGVSVQIGTLQDFGDAMLESGIEFPVIRGDMSDTWIRGIGSAPQGVSMMRNLQGTLRNREAALNLLRLMQYPAEDTREIENSAYEKLLLFGEHTWGMDTKVTILPPRGHGDPWDGFRFWQSGTLDRDLFCRLRTTDPDYLKLQASWEEQLDYVRNAKKSVDTLTEIAERQIPAGEGFTIFGSLGIRCTCPVKIDHVIPEKNMFFAVTDESGNRYPMYKTADGTLTADLPLPALGTACFQLSKETILPEEVGRIDGEKVILENENLRLCVDMKSGAFVSFIDKNSGREWVDTRETENFGGYRYDIYSGEELVRYLKDYSYDLRDWSVSDLGKAGYPRTQPHLTFYPKLKEMRMENTSWGGVLTWRMGSEESGKLYGDGENLEFTLALGRANAFVDFTVQVHGKKATPLMESGHVVFPLAAENPCFRINKFGCVLDPEKDILQDGNRDLYCVEDWMTVEDQGCGFAIMPKDMPLFSLGNPGVLRFTRHPGRQKPVVWMQLFNNTWGTNFPQWIQGEMTFSYRLMPYQGTWDQADVWQNARIFRAAPLAASGIMKTAELLPEGLQDMMLSSWKRSEDGEGWILRLHDISGRFQTKRLKLNPYFRQVWKCSLTEEITEECLQKDGVYEFDSNPFEIHTFYLR